jgi:mannose-6-phosphate isomerase-like protein (cupin superfamily)
MHLGPSGVLGSHPAAKAQLFCIVVGEGKVSDDDGNVVAIHAGQAALWEAGEVHETTTRRGLTAIIIEVDAIRL